MVETSIMIFASKFRRKLRQDAQGVSDEDIEHILDLERRLADIIFDMWLEDRDKQNTN